MKKLILFLCLIPFLGIAQNTTPFKDTIKIGNSLNNVQIDSENGIILNGTASYWDDYVSTAIQTKQGQNNLPTFNYDSLALELVYDVDSNEIQYHLWQIPHKTKENSMCSPHIHWIQTNIADTTWNLRLVYKIRPLGEKPRNWVYINIEKRNVLTFKSPSIHQIADFPMIDLSGIDFGDEVRGSSYIDFIIYRYDNVGLSTVYQKGFDIHFESDKLGSNDEYTN